MLNARYVPKQLRVQSDPDAVVMRDPEKWPMFPLLNILQHGIVWIVTLAWLRVFGKLTERERGRQLRILLETLGGLWIKVGQLISLRRDLFSNDFCTEVAKLQDRAFGFQSGVAKQILADSLRAPIEDYFECFDERPIAAASIGQVHRARLRRESLWVAVKIQRPNIDRRFQRDLSLIRRLTSIADWLKLFPYLHLAEMVSEIEHIAAEELDYRIEAANITRMRRTLRKHTVYAPRVFEAYTSRHILVMEFIDGVLMSDLIDMLHTSPRKAREWLHENDIDPERVAKTLFRSTLSQLFEDNLFHGDLHPGNIMLLRGNRVALIDFGAIGSLETEYRARYQLFVESLANGEYARGVDFLFLICSPLPLVDTNEVKQKVVRTIKAWELRTFAKGLPYHDKSLSALMTGIVKVLVEYEIWTNWAFMRIDRVTLSLDASLSELAPAANYPAMLRTYFHHLRSRELEAQIEEVRIEETLLKLHAAGSALVQAATDFPVLQEPMMRRAAQDFSGDIDNVSYLFVVVFRSLFWGTVVAGLVLVLCFLSQHHHSLVEWLWPVLGVGMTDYISDFPNFGYFAWLVIFLVVFAIARMWAGLKARFEKQVVRSPTSTRVSIF